MKKIIEYALIVLIPLCIIYWIVSRIIFARENKRRKGIVKRRHMKETLKDSIFWDRLEKEDPNLFKAWSNYDKVMS